MKKLIAAMLFTLFCVLICGISIAEDAKAAKPSAPVQTAGPVKATAGRPIPRANLSILYGNITKIDNADPANVKIEIKNEMDDTVHTVELTPATSVTKATDASELKTGENVRVMARKADNKEVAIGVMFGKIRKPAPRPVRAAVVTPAASAPATQATPKK
jgi:Cu/Ag efflux protein CusF